MAFKVKLLTGELPTLLNLYYRHPSKYQNPICPRCRREWEDQVHWLVCRENNYTLQHAISETLEEIKDQLNISDEDKRRFIYQMISTTCAAPKPTTPSIILQYNILPNQVSPSAKLTTKFMHILVQKIYTKI